MSLQHMILGLLDMRPMSGYDLNKAFHNTVQHFWYADQSQIYRALHKLHEQEWVEMERIVQADHPVKKIYRPTETGLAELRRWVLTPIAESQTRQAWLGQIFFGARYSNAELAAVLQQYRGEMLENLHILEALLQMLQAYQENRSIRREEHLQMLTLDYGLQTYRFEISWLDQALASIAALPEDEAEDT